MTLDEAKALIEAADALPERATDEQLLAVGYIKTEGGVWELPLTVVLSKQLLRNDLKKAVDTLADTIENNTYCKDGGDETYLDYDEIIPVLNRVVKDVHKLLWTD